MMTNKGISFGFEFPGVLIVSVLVWFLMLYWWYQKKDWALLLIIIGGGMNLAERIIWGSVRDYWRIPGLSIYNNINDWLIFWGIVIFIWNHRKRK